MLFSPFFPIEVSPVAFFFLILDLLVVIGALVRQSPTFQFICLLVHPHLLRRKRALLILQPRRYSRTAGFAVIKRAIINFGCGGVVTGKKKVLCMVFQTLGRGYGLEFFSLASLHSGITCCALPLGQYTRCTCTVCSSQRGCLAATKDYSPKFLSCPITRHTERTQNSGQL